MATKRMKPTDQETDKHLVVIPPALWAKLTELSQAWYTGNNSATLRRLIAEATDSPIPPARSKMSAERISIIQAALEAGESGVVIARVLGIDPSEVSRLKGKLQLPKGRKAAGL